MKGIHVLKVIVLFGILSCNNNKSDKVIKNENVKLFVLPNDTAFKSKQQMTDVVSVTINAISVDDYPVTNEMLEGKKEDQSSHKMQSGQTYSYDKVWFSNDTLKQTIVFELYTDYHRMVTYHFYNNNIPADLINIMELNIDGGELASEKQKQKDFNGFIKQTAKINSSYFVSEKGFRLSDTKQKAIDIYGKPDRYSMKDESEKLEWDFIGDKLYESKTSFKDKPFAKNSFGYKIIMYFSNGKLIAQILHNDIP